MKTKLSVLLLTLSLTACNIMDSATINSQAAQSYRQTVSQAQEHRMIDTTSNTAKRVQRVFQKLVPYATAANTTGQPFQWEMNVIRSDELNAWAMPGGKMVVYTGIVEKLNLSDAELAAIVGHEMTHALLEHSKKEANRSIGLNLGAQIGANILTAATGIDGNLIGTGVGLATDLGIAKPFSRSAEREADLGGLKLMAQAGYNPEAAITVWTKMNQENDNNNAANAILSTHPTNNARIELIRQELPKVMPIYQQAIAKK
ncbi:M48 family metallopeptidase [Kingella negevensis]|uniref:Metalloprotease LoiP n=1 Tax=Kingella negevensis TaxID=1522312 RepID=A0A238HGI5_9NEIS|nr:M48 family metallopeptidase [Kingella negevensis]MDK4681135.1 M48 family metallopeptidase [Kingella negevensis]MDK4683337.1 M48 family metallopeptidase [Kingella negevensis]MDK4684341.1 M48 family metallopeptidase [Kingella negevensis]MDK4691533.1 M48 family metallopeptidase [Kingella negevensis]MDK4693316.1 M48 family metallopeptidase [Kingella negevensis]